MVLEKCGPLLIQSEPHQYSSCISTLFLLDSAGVQTLSAECKIFRQIVKLNSEIHFQVRSNGRHYGRTADFVAFWLSLRNAYLTNECRCRHFLQLLAKKPEKKASLGFYDIEFNN